MINIYLSFETKNKIRFFKQLNLDIFKKYNINLRSSLKDSSIVFFLYNSGNSNLFKKELTSLKEFNHNKKHDLKTEFEMIKYYIKLNKKIIIYLRNDGSGIYENVNLLINEYPNHILFVIKDFMLKEEKYYPTQGCNYGKYLIYKQFEKPNTRQIKNLYNSFKKYFCYTIPYNRAISYGFLGKKYETPKQEKIYDIFFIKRFREGQLNCLLRKKTLEHVLKLKDKYKICTDSCSKDEYKIKLAQSKICISTWGLGESLNDDYFCILNDVIVLKVDTTFLKDFYGLFEKNNIFHFHKLDFSDFESKIDNILNNYDYYYDLHEKNRNKIINKFTKDYHIKVLSDKIKKEYNKIK